MSMSNLGVSSDNKRERESMENRFLHIVDVRDVVDALLLAYEKTEATGRYICCAHTIKACDFINKLKSMYPNYKYPKTFTEVEQDNVLSSEKLKQLGWKHRTLEESIKDTVEYFRKSGVSVEANVRNVRQIVPEKAPGRTRITGGVKTQAPVRLPGSPRPLMVEIVAWGGYNRPVSQGACSETFGRNFRAGVLQGGHERCSVTLRVVPCSKAAVPVRNLSAGVR
ncbi:hypothetical protein Taro_030934 [Colocasia esculenta]|uniref:Uncharacterized protein n=1 Tax=Colocasia esculenta TaxID=4460 RepID=A0A843VT94_COLES|nr:hypothetical protein [Colocasia esculenta]